MIDRACEDKCCRTPTFAGAGRNNVQTNCATRVCRACVELTVCVAVRYPITANISRNKRNDNPTAVSYFRSGRRSLVCAELSNKGKVGVQRGRETAGVPSSLPPRRAPRRSRRPQTANPLAEVQRKTLRPERANTLTQFAHPGFPVQKRSRPVRANTLTQFAHPGFPVQRKEPPVRANTLTQFAHPRSAGAEKTAARTG